MPVFLAILSLASGLQRARAGDKFGGLATMAKSVGNLTNMFSVGNDFSNVSADAGVRRNYL